MREYGIIRVPMRKKELLTRAKKRHRELKDMGINIALYDVLVEMEQQDKQIFKGFKL